MVYDDGFVVVRDAWVGFAAFAVDALNGLVSPADEFGGAYCYVRAVEGEREGVDFEAQLGWEVEEKALLFRLLGRHAWLILPFDIPTGVRVDASKMSATKSWSEGETIWKVRLLDCFDA